MKINSLTPRQYAYDLAVGWLRNAHNGYTSDIDDLTPEQKMKVKEEIVKLHNQLIMKANLESSLYE